MARTVTSRSPGWAQEGSRFRTGFSFYNDCRNILGITPRAGPKVSQGFPHELWYALAALLQPHEEPGEFLFLPCYPGCWNSTQYSVEGGIAQCHDLVDPRPEILQGWPASVDGRARVQTL